MKNKSGKISIINTQYGRFYLTDIKTAIKIFDYKGYIEYFSKKEVKGEIKKGVNYDIGYIR